jgi:hypothetical protein
LLHDVNDVYHISDMNPLCSLCKVELETDEEDKEKMVCPSCTAVYMPAKEMMEYSDDESVGSIHDDEMPELTGAGGALGIELATDETDPSMIDMLYKDPKNKPSQGTGTESWD